MARILLSQPPKVLTSFISSTAFEKHDRWETIKSYMNFHLELRSIYFEVDSPSDAKRLGNIPKKRVDWFGH